MKYFANDLTRRATSGMNRMSMALFDAAVDLNPHQIEAALFAMQSAFGKTIEAGIVLCQFGAERKRRLLVICPASIRKQWALELEEKFNLPTRVLDAKAYREAQRSGRAPSNETAVLIMSLNYQIRTRMDDTRRTLFEHFDEDVHQRLRLQLATTSSAGRIPRHPLFSGGNNLENLKAPDDTWKVRLIEEDFHRLMFEAEGA